MAYCFSPTVAPKRRAIAIALLGWGAVPALLSMLLPQPALAETGAEPEPPESAATERLFDMFAAEIQTTVNACAEQGKVNLAAGEAGDGSVLCGDGSSDADVTYASYVDTVSDILVASSLVGFRAVAASDPRIPPSAINMFLADARGTELLRTSIGNAIGRSQLFASNSPESNFILTNEVVDRLRLTLQDISGLENLLGTTDQYGQVVDNFCSSPGMSVNQAKTLVPGLNSVQLYAICVEESGITEELLRG